jgi:hypothetical protein
MKIKAMLTLQVICCVQKLPLGTAAERWCRNMIRFTTTAGPLATGQQGQIEPAALGALSRTRNKGPFHSSMDIIAAFEAEEK